MIKHAYITDRRIDPGGQADPAPPVANFIYVVNGAVVTFIDQSVNANQWDWDFGDGFQSTLRNPIHTYQSSGDFTVTLQINGTGPTHQEIVSVALPAPDDTLYYMDRSIDEFMSMTLDQSMSMKVQL